MLTFDRWFSQTIKVAGQSHKRILVLNDQAGHAL